VPKYDFVSKVLIYVFVMIKHLELQNFRSHRNTKLDFTEGNNILVGISGSGKSSVLDAICFALFGTITKIQRKKIKVSDLVMSKPTKENEAGNRMTHIDELLRLEMFESIRSKATRCANRFRNQEISKKETIASINEKEIRERKTFIEKELKNLEKDNEIIEKELRETQKRIDSLEKDFASLMEKKKKIEKLKENITRLQGLISFYEEELSKHEKFDLSYLKNEYEKKKDLLDQKENGNLKIEKELSSISYRIDELDKDLEEKRQANNFLRQYDSNNFQIVKKDLEKMRKSFFEKKLRKGSINEAINKLKETQGICPICDRELTESKRKDLIESKTAELKKLEEEMRRLDKFLGDKEKELEKEQSEFEKAKYFERRLKELGDVESRLEEQKRKFFEVQSKKEDLRGLKEEVEELKKGYDKALDLKEKEEKLKECKGKEAVLRKIMEEIDFDENRLEKVRSKLEIQKSRKIGLDKDLEFKKDLKEEKKKLFNQLKRDLDFLEMNKREIEFLSHASKTLAKLSNSLIEVQETLREEFVKTLNEVMNEIWNDLYPYEDYIGIRFKIEERDYLLQLCDLKNKWMNVEGFSSGGERAIASLVMRIALSVILAPRLKVLMLDEPTHNLDSNTMEKLIDILKTHISNLIEQLFIVTHDERLIQAGTGYTYEFLRESAKRESTKVNSLTI